LVVGVISGYVGYAYGAKIKADAAAAETAATAVKKAL
jgi:hypothetical protein